MIKGFENYLKTSQNLRRPIDITNGGREISRKNDTMLYDAMSVIGTYVPDRVIDRISMMMRQKTIIARKQISDRCSMAYMESNPPTKMFLDLGASVAGYIEGTFMRTPLKVTVYYLGDVLGNKELPRSLSKKFKKQTIMSPSEVNSGVTYGDEFHSIIVIFRREEAEKVLVHELLHAYRFELRSAPKESLQKRWGIVSDVPILLNETYVEVIASFMYAHASGLNLTELKTHFLNQAEKIMCMMTYAGEFRQKTHVFEYYIVKAAMFNEMSPRDLSQLMDTSSQDRLLQFMLDATDEYLKSFSCGLSMTIVS